MEIQIKSKQIEESNDTITITTKKQMNMETETVLYAKRDKCQ